MWRKGGRSWCEFTYCCANPTVSLDACHADAYVDGPGIISELIQNADDAGAKEVALMLDTTTYPSQSILGETLRNPKKPYFWMCKAFRNPRRLIAPWNDAGEKLAAWQGPALYCWNDQIFSPSDFHSISKVGFLNVCSNKLQNPKEPRKPYESCSAQVSWPSLIITAALIESATNLRMALLTVFWCHRLARTRSWIIFKQLVGLVSVRLLMVS